MEYRATFAHGLTSVFAHLAMPERLGAWLPEVLHAECWEAQTHDACIGFDLIVQRDGIQRAAHGEIIAFEPPAMVAYRLFIEEQTRVVRVTCAACDDGTRVRISLAGGNHPLAVDLARLDRAIGVRPHSEYDLGLDATLPAQSA